MKFEFLLLTLPAHQLARPILESFKTMFFDVSPTSNVKSSTELMNLVEDQIFGRVSTEMPIGLSVIGKQGRQPFLSVDTFVTHIYSPPSFGKKEKYFRPRWHSNRRSGPSFPDAHRIEEQLRADIIKSARARPRFVQTKSMPSRRITKKNFGRPDCGYSY